MKILNLLIISLLIIGIVPVLAQEDNPGVTPDSFWYGLDRALERIELMLTFGKAEKAKKGLEHARERLAEVKAMIEQNKLEAAEKAKKDHDEILEDVKDKIEEVEEEPEEELEKELDLEERLNKHELAIEDAELDIEIKIRGKLTEEKRELVDNLIESFKGKAGEVKIIIKNKEEKIKEKLKEKKSEEEVEKLVKEKREKLGLFDGKLADKMVKRAEAFVNVVTNRMEEEKKKDIDVSEKEEVLGQVELLLEQARNLKEEGKFEEAKEIAEQAKKLAESLKIKGTERAAERITIIKEVLEKREIKSPAVMEKLMGIREKLLKKPLVTPLEKERGPKED